MKTKEILKWVNDQGYDLEDIPILLKQYVDESIAKDTQIEKLKEEDVKKTLLINKYLERADELKELVKLYKGIVHFDDKTITDNSSLRDQIAQLEKELNDTE